MLSPTTETIESIATIIGIDEYEVSELLKLSSERRVLYHGVKKQSYLQRVENEGIKPLTPESRASHWTTGIRTFVNRTGRFGEGSLATYDTPWFLYSGAALVLTDQNTLREYGTAIEWVDHGEIKIPVIVPRPAITIVSINGDSNTLPSREARQLEERAMLEVLLNHLRNYSIGKIIPLPYHVGIS